METVERFVVLETYANSIRTLAQGNEAVAYELSYWIIQYGIYGKEPPKNSNPIVIAFFNQIRVPIDTWRKQYINWSKGWRPKKGFENLENSQKPKPNPTLTQTKPKPNPTPNPNETKIKNKNIKIKKENIKEKKLFWDFVLLTDKEYSKLLEIFWEQRLKQVIEQMNNAIWQHWYTYKSHYFAIRNWFSKEIEELEAKKKRKEENKSLPDYDHLDPIIMP